MRKKETAERSFVYVCVCEREPYKQTDRARKGVILCHISRTAGDGRGGVIEGKVRPGGREETWQRP